MNYYTQLCGNYTRSINQPVQWKVRPFFFCGSCDLEVVLFLQGDYFTLPFGLKVKLQIPLIYIPPSQNAIVITRKNPSQTSIWNCYPGSGNFFWKFFQTSWDQPGDLSCHLRQIPILQFSYPQKSDVDLWFYPEADTSTFEFHHPKN